MQILFQSVYSSVTKVNKFVAFYVSSLLLSREEKNCASMARELCIGAKKLYLYFSISKEDIAQIRLTLEKMAIDLFVKSKLKVLVIDSTRIRKLYASAIEYLRYDYDGSLGHVVKGLTIVMAIITSSTGSIPINFKFYLGKKFAPEGFLTKIDLAICMIKETVASKIPFDCISMDGGFSSISMFNFLITCKLQFVIRFAKNRIVIINGKADQIRNHTCFKFFGHQKVITVKGFYKGMELFFTAERRHSKDGTFEIVFYASNFEAKPSDYLKVNSLRWNIESTTRTNKQKIGFSDCRMLDTFKQSAHIWAVFFSYALGTKLKIFKKKKNVDQVLNILRDQKQIDVQLAFFDLVNVLSA